ncbi:MAG: hypothetical protein EOO88_15925 [Pedobacter sp.]|nr:MAG: hypothetical protein EOO88_15925 [Pedobacter sp.]
MTTFRSLFLFQWKLIVPALVLSVLLAALMMELDHLRAGIGIAFIFFMPTMHYFRYELKNPEEYFFYYNMGLSKLRLWIYTIIFSLSAGLLLMI